MRKKVGRGSNIGVSIVLSLGISALLYVILYKWFPIVYSINDDVTMRDIAAGAFGDRDAHLIFIKYPLGVFISWLYGAFAGFDWYGILMTGFIMMCLSLVLYRGLSDIKSGKNKIIYVVLSLVFFACIGVRHVVIFQWTVTAGILGATGVFFFYTSSEENKWKNCIEEVIAAFMLILAFCIRENILLMIVPAAGICYLFKYVKIDKEKRKFLSVRHIWFWPLVLIGCGVVMLIESAAYREEGWKEYQEFNAYRSEIYDYYGVPPFEEHKEFYDSIEMGKEDVEALKRYSLLLVDGIIEYKMKAIAEYAKEIQGEQENVGMRFIKGAAAAWMDFQSGTYSPLGWLGTSLLICTMALCYFHKSRRFELMFLCIGIQLLLWCYLGFKGRMVERVSFVMHLYMFMITGGILYKELVENGIWSRNQAGWREGLMIICGILSLLMVSMSTCYKVKQEAAKIAERNKEYTEVCEYMMKTKEKLYFLHVDAFAQFTDNFQIRREFETSNMVSLGGWTTFSPVEIRKRDHLSVLNVKEAIYRNDNVYVMSRSDMDMIYIENYLKKEYGTCHSKLLDTIAYEEYYYTVEEFGQ